MKHTQVIVLSAVCAALLMNQAQAASAQHNDFAKVISAKPVYQTIERQVPQERCWTETVKMEAARHASAHERHSSTPTLIGGVIGGVIGSELGRGRDNKKIGAVVGSLLGMSIAKDVQRRNHNTQVSPTNREVRYRDVERCEVSYLAETENVLQGYDVIYRYQGRRYSTFTQNHPGAKLAVNVSVKPAKH